MVKHSFEGYYPLTDCKGTNKDSKKLNLRRSFNVLRRRFNVLRRSFIILRRRFNFCSVLSYRKNRPNLHFERFFPYFCPYLSFSRLVTSQKVRLFFLYLFPCSYCRHHHHYDPIAHHGITMANHSNNTNKPKTVFRTQEFMGQIMRIMVISFPI